MMMDRWHEDDHSVFSASDIEASMNAHSQGNVYDVEHLATFELSEELALPADGMRRLLHMEKNGFGIWSQKMRIRLENRYIVILDFENGDEMERFPLHLIRDPTAFTNSNPGELYNNIFAFIVHPVEMHIFQCYNISAADLVEDVKMALSGRLPPNRLGSQNSLPPPPVNPPPEPPNFHNHHGDDNNRDDTSSVGSEGRYEREVAILNRCFDDIERFIARLQYAAAAFRELQRRRKSKKSKKKDHGEGLLSLRARSPHEREFVDILQKFKLSFNLLAKLKSHIHDPNAPELVHFLFTPLALIVDASRDAHTVGLAPRVVSPLLTREAIELLNNCLTSKETELWHSLGDAWLLSRDQWKGYVAPYQPVFMDGWSPVIPETNLGAAVATEAQRRVQEIRVAREHEAEQQRRVESSRDRSISPVEMTGDDFSAGQRAFVDSVRSHGGRVVVVSHPRTANNHKELTVVRGEYLEVLDDSKKWWKARNWKGQVAHVPHTIVSELPQESPSASAAYHNDNGRTDNWSSPSSTVSSDDDGFPSGRRGNLKNVPYTPPPMPPPPPRKQDQVDGRKKQPPAVPPKSPTKQRPLSEDLMQRELKNVLMIFRENRHINIVKTPEVYINQHSSAPEVKQWLKQKGFSERIIRQMSGMDGNELFSLTKKQLEDFCGKEEGRRLDSQITVSRNISGYKTARSSELRAILAKARAKVEIDDDDDESPKQSGNKYNGNHHSSNNNNNNNQSKNSNDFSPRSSESPDSLTEANTKMNAGKSRPPIPPQYDNHGVTDSESDNDDDSMDGKSTLGRMLRQKRGEILKK